MLSRHQGVGGPQHGMQAPAQLRLAAACMPCPRPPRPLPPPRHRSCTSDGVCECEASWSGGDCSVSLNATCLAGSRRGVPRPEGHGTCWQECRCDDAGKECGCAVKGVGGRAEASHQCGALVSRQECMAPAPLLPLPCVEPLSTAQWWLLLPPPLHTAPLPPHLIPDPHTIRRALPAASPPSARTLGATPASDERPTPPNACRMSAQR